ncbi:MAG TPA: TonB-dependent receptor [Saprospiraceae bacterium]|nr:TonB-dependent receptor [Saprospiraceae bacterium]HMQ85542.1 TonB-dependent receptor [Saprospiraceae bacterium]
MEKFIWIISWLILGLLPNGNFAQNRIQTTPVEIWVDGACGMCQERIEKAAIETAGVISAHWNMDTKMLRVETDPELFSEDNLHWAVTGVGHDTKKWKADEEVYEQLHACCHYRPEPLPDDPHLPDYDDHGANLGQVSGYIFEPGEKNKKLPLPGVNLYWLGTTQGTTTDAEGFFQLEKHGETDRLVISYVGFAADTLAFGEQTYVEVVLSDAVVLEGVEVVHNRRATEISFLAPIKFLEVNQQELRKAACCNLSESFETNPSVDVSFTDAITGARQIEMLGLAGPYVQIGRELLPDVRGLSAIYGFTYTPGPWVESIQLAKGPGSVVNGFESMTGQINVELKKPNEGEKLHLNTYANTAGRMEANANWRKSLSEIWHTGLLFHYNDQRFINDMNDDHFLDNPLGNQVVLANRWKYTGSNGWEGQFGVKGVYYNKQSGETEFDRNKDKTRQTHWGSVNRSDRADVWAKVGRVFPNPNKSIGLQLSATYHQQDAFYGLRDYDATQKSAYANLIYQSIIGNPNHSFKTGLSFQWDQVDETFADSDFYRNELVPGAYFEYTYTPDPAFTGLLGIRVDQHNIFGVFVTPRVHLRYALNERTVLRASAGRGQRTATILAENIGALASARSIIIHSQNADTPYGLNPEISWNYGLNLTQEIALGKRDLLFSVDVYHTRFVSQIVVDYDQHPQELHFYNLEGVSYANSIQVQADYEVLPKLDVRMAYRFNDVVMTFQEGVLERPMVARHRAFINLGYEASRNWNFDFTLNWQGAKRLPDTSTNPEDYQMPQQSPDFFLANAQISKAWNKKWEVYVGAENLFNFMQHHAILSHHNPFGTYFDASMVWGPTFGRMVYVGGRFTVE